MSRILVMGLVISFGFASAEAQAPTDEVGSIAIETNVAAAQVAVDGGAFAELDSGPLRVPPGVHRLTLRAAGHEDATTEVAVVAAQEVRVRVELRALPLVRLEIRSSPRDVLVRVDGRTIGTTPLDGPIELPAGRHRIEATRAGYLVAIEEIDLVPDQPAVRTMRLSVDPAATAAELGRISFRVPLDARLWVDGMAVDPRIATELPVGSHVVDVRVPDRRPWRRAIVIAAGEEATIAPRLSWNAEARAEHMADADSTRSAAWVVTVLGAALTGTAAVALAVSVATIEARIAELEAERFTCFGRDCIRVFQETEDCHDARGVWLGVTVPGLVVGGALLVSGLVMHALVPSEDDIDDAATVLVALSPGHAGAVLRGAL